MKNEVTKFYGNEAHDYHAVRYGSWYGRLFAQLHHAVLRDTVALLAPEASVLDVATGTGHSLDVLQHAGGARFATDLTIEMLDACRSRIDPMSNIHYVLSDALHLPFPDNSFDFVNSSRFLHLLPKSGQRKVLDELQRVLRPGGLLVVDFYNHSHWSLLHLPISIYRRMKNKRPTEDTLNTPSEVTSWIEGCGLKIGRMMGIGSYSLILCRFLPNSLAVFLGRCFRWRFLLPLAEQFVVVAYKRK